MGKNKKKATSLEAQCLASSCDSHAKRSPASTESSEPEGESLDEAIAKLSPEQAEMFMKVLTLTMKKRRIMLFGNLIALFLMLACMLWAFVAYANRTPDSFSAWVFLVPFACAGLCLWIFGRLASQAGAKTTTALDEGRQAQEKKHA